MKVMYKYDEIDSFCLIKGSGRKTYIAKPEGSMKLLWRIKAAIQVLRGKGVPVEWK